MKDRDPAFSWVLMVSGSGGQSRWGQSPQTLAASARTRCGSRVSVSCPRPRLRLTLGGWSVARASSPRDGCDIFRGGRRLESEGARFHSAGAQGGCAILYMRLDAA